MSVLLALLMFALVMLLGCLFARREKFSAKAHVGTEGRPRYRSSEGTFGLQVPQGYCLHPCHTWALEEGWQLVRVGLDNFAANLFGSIEHIDAASPCRWVRQGQKLM